MEGVEDTKTFKLKVETMVYSDSIPFTIIAFSGNELTTKYESGEEFNARFVVLKCDVND